MALCFYHVTCSTILFNAPRFIPHTFGAFAESYVFQIISHRPASYNIPSYSRRATPEVVWGTFHGVVGLTLAIWWQATLGITAAARPKTQ